MSLLSIKNMLQSLITSFKSYVTNFFGQLEHSSTECTLHMYLLSLLPKSHESRTLDIDNRPRTFFMNTHFIVFIIMILCIHDIRPYSTV